MKTKLYLITNDFPFGKGENSFILPELSFLVKDFEVTIISTSLSEDRTADVDAEIKVIHYDRKEKLLRKLLDCASYLGHKACYKEMLDIFRSGGNVFGKLFESVLFYEEAKRFERYLRKNRIIDDNNSCVVYSYWYTFYCLTMTEYFKNKENIKLITRAHRYDLYDEGSRFGRQPFKKYMNNRMDYIVFIAEHGRQYFYQKYGRERKKEQYQLFRLGVEKPDPIVTGRHSNKFLMASCSLAISRKRIELIIEGLSQLSNERIRWVHFGDGPELNSIKQYADKLLGNKHNIEYEWMGYVDSNEIIKFYQKSEVDLFITTSASEGCPVSLQEAMSCGIPVIGTAVAEIPYMIEGNGILLDENPTGKDVAEAISHIYDLETEERIQMRKRSLELWDERFNLDKNADAFLNFLRRVSTEG